MYRHPVLLVIPIHPFFALFVDRQTLDSSATMTTPSNKPSASDVDIDRLLKSEATALQRQVEVCIPVRQSNSTKQLANR